MSGYTPLFSSLTTGTLCGKWPDIGLWPIILSLSDKDGIVDVTPSYISGVTGLAVDEVEACMKRFCEPDRYSRSNVAAGARLVLLDEHRDWGWKIVNHGSYREKARLAAKSAREVETGKNAARMANRPPLTAADRRPPPETASDPLSNSNSNSNKTKKPDRRTARAVDEPAEFVELQREYPKRAGGQRWGDALRFFKRRIAEGEQASTILAGVRRYAEFTRAVGIERTEKVQQAATFLGENRGYLEQWQAPPRAKSAVEQAREDLRRNRHVDSTVVSEQAGSGGASHSDLGSFARLLR